MGGRETALWVVSAGWLAAVLGGFWFWERADGTPGAIGPAVAGPDEPGLGRWRVTAFLHPHCPCSRATLRELAELVAAAPAVAARVVFVRPADCPDGWERGEAWELAARIPGAELTCDATGAQARRFGAETSGQVVLTDPGGMVVFRGGITQARGRTGDSTGRRAVLAWVNTGAGAATAPVYGCRLFTPE